MLPIVVMLWRLYLARKRKIFFTIIEIFFPVIVFIAYIKMKLFSSELDLRPDAVSYPVAAAPLRVFYSPNTELTHVLMNEVGRRLFLNRLDHVPRGLEEGFAPVSDRLTMEQYSDRMEVGDAIVIFQDMDGSNWPKTLNYTIRMKSGLRPQNFVKIVMGSGTALDQFDTIYEPFTRLQWALDISFLQMVTSLDINPTLMLVEEMGSHPRRAGEYVAIVNPLAPVHCIIIRHVSNMALCIPMLFFVMRLADEKNSGIQELLKLSSISELMLYTLHYINMAPGALIYALGAPLCLKVGEKPVLPNTSYFLLVLIFGLTFCSLIAFAGFITCLFVPKRPFAFGMTAYAVIVVLFPIFSGLLTIHISAIAIYVLLFVPMEPARWVFAGIGLFELHEQGAGFGALPANSPAGLNNIGTSCLAMVLQIALYFKLGEWMDRIKPGPYGKAQDTRKICSLWKTVAVVEADESTKPVPPDPKYFEQLPSDLPVGIRVKQVTKVFPQHVALANLTLDVFKGEITLLLGHNGAGKTTLINIISGMYEPTSGRVEINGIDVGENRSEAYRQMGMCPQHNLFFPDLTVMEHVMIFAMLKGFCYTEATTSAGAIIKKLGLEGKENNIPSTLSGGMKRRVQLACALAGDSSVLILDEPTSGLDVETRRGLWDLLLSLRGERTVVLTTHFMEEADALGDRVAALHCGRLKCHATPMFLKKAVGGGYRLTITAEEGNEVAITNLIHNSVPSASISDKTHKVTTYNLPSSASSKFPEMFSNLEGNKENLQIISIGVGRSTLDDVFIRLCSDTVTGFEELPFTDEPEFQKITGKKLYLRMWIILMQRQMSYVRSNLISYIPMHALMPFAIAFAGGYLINQSIASEGSSSKIRGTMKVKPADMFGGNQVTYTVLSGSYSSLPSIGYEYVDSKQSMDLAANLLQTGNKKDFQINLEYNDTYAKAMYGASARHAAPVAVNLLTNSLARRWLGSSGTSITVVNQPLDLESELIADSIYVQKDPLTLLLYGLLVCFQCVQVVNFSISLAVKERLACTRHIHQTCGCPLALYWTVTLTFHLLAVLFFAIVPNLFALLILDKDNIVNDLGFLAVISLITFLSTLAFAAFYHAVGTKCSESVASLLMNIVVVIFGIYSAMFEFVLESIASGRDYFVEVISYISPLHDLVMGVYKCGLTANLNAKCRILRRNCPNLQSNDLQFDDERCCASKGNFESYIRMDHRSAGKELVVVCLQMCFYIWLLLMMDSGVFSTLREKWSRSKANKKSRFSDDLVMVERIYVAKAIRTPRKMVKEALLCYDVHKQYSKCCKDFMAVNGLSFSVQRCECYGLLGVNGAGKSTTFKMITAETYPTRGHLLSNGYYINEKIPYMQTFSYCPQFFGLDDFLTGEQNMILVLTLRGLSTIDAKEQAASWLKEIGLQKYANRCVSTYSGGCTRRLAAVAALCQRSHVALLDEPTTGVDTAARRRVHAAVLRAKRTKSVVIASHSMDEIEALCDRICIMSAGEAAALGSAAELRARHATGFSAVFKLSAPTEAAIAAAAEKSAQEDESLPPPEHPKKQQFLQKMYAAFDCRLVDDHRTMCHIHINDLMPYSKLFEIVEALKIDFLDLIEDYVVSETTLEEVFIAIAKEGQEYVEGQKNKTPEAT